MGRYTYYLLEFLERVTPGSKETMDQLFKICPKHQCISTVGVSTDLFKRDTSKTLITDFFGSVRSVDLIDNGNELTLLNDNSAQINHSKGSVKSSKNYSYVSQFDNWPGKSTEISGKTSEIGKIISSLLLSH